MDTANTAPASTAKKTPSQLRRDEIIKRRLKFVESLRNDPEMIAAITQNKGGGMSQASEEAFVLKGVRL